VLEQRGLRVGDVRFAFLLHVDAALRRDALRPSEPEHPARGVIHVDAHVAEDAVAVFGESAPPAFVREPVVRPQRRVAGPRFVVEEIGHSLDGRGAVRAHVKVAAHVHVADFSEQAGVDDLLLRLDEMRRAFALRANLHHADEPARGIQQRLAFAYVHADRLLAIHISVKEGDGTLLDH